MPKCKQNLRLSVGLFEALDKKKKPTKQHKLPQTDTMDSEITES